MAVKRSRKTAGKTRKTKKAKKLATRSKRAIKLSNLKSGTNIGRLTFRQYVNAKRKAKQNEIREYEQKYLSRYKQPKSEVKKPSNLKHDTDIGTLSLRPYLNANRKAMQEELKK